MKTLMIKLIYEASEFGRTNISFQKTPVRNLGKDSNYCDRDMIECNESTTRSIANCVL